MMNLHVSARPQVRIMLALIFAGVLASGGLAMRVSPALAATPCDVWSLATTTDGVWMNGISRMDCPSNPISDWLNAEMVEWAFPGAYFSRATGINNTNSQFQIQVQLSYYCNGHGTDDWQMHANGRDANGGESGWLWGSATSHTC